MPAARQSTQVTVEHEQQPDSAIRLQRMQAAAFVEQPEGKRGLARSTSHKLPFYLQDVVRSV